MHIEYKGISNRKLILSIISAILLCISFIYDAKAAEINNFDDLYNSFNDPECDGVLDIENDITTNSGLGCPKRDSITINGNNHILNGNNNEGITLDNERKLSITEIDAENFSSNDNGGFLKNNRGCAIENMNGTFCNNKTEQEGGVLYNNSDIKNIDGNFNNNCSVKNGGAIFNDYAGRVDNISSEFKCNCTNDSTGGAICNFGNIKRVNAYFEGNKTYTGSGGAIANYQKIEQIEGNFEGNEANQSGGAIFNTGQIDNINANFKSNTSKTDNKYFGGGAINNYGTINKLSGRFENNSASGMGGAIYNAYGKINIVSDENEVVFLNNTDSTGSNAIYNEAGEININAENYDVIINDKISGSKQGLESGSQIININNPEVSQTNNGSVIIGNEVLNNEINMYGGELKLVESETGSYGTFDNSVTFNYYGGDLNLQDESIHNTNLGQLNLYNDMNLKLDANFEDKTIDTLTLKSFTSNDYNIYITDLYLMTTTEEKKFTLSPIGDDIDEEIKSRLKEAIVYKAGDVINSPVYEYRTSYNPQNGLITFERIENLYNPSILSSSVAAQAGGYLTQINTYEEAFRKMDLYMLFPRQKRLTIKLNNRYANSDGSTITKYQSNIYDNNYIWIRPYSIFEKVELKRGPKVSNTAYGSFIGIETPIKELKSGGEIITVPYIGYNGSHQRYDGVGIYQNGATLGALLMGYKGNFFSGLTANISSNGCEADTMYGKENFTMLMTGAALKSGYNFEFKEGKFIIQPNYLMSYTLVNTFNYKNAAGININTRPLNAIQISPGIQLAGNYENGWQPFINTYMVWNLIDKAEFKANDISLPALSIKPYILYGIGLRKLWDDNFTGFYQTYITNGGRNGIGINFGLRYAIKN